LRLKSEEAKDSRFVMQMPFILPEYEDQGKDEGERPSLLKMGSESSVTTPPPTITEGELTLVDKMSSLRKRWDHPQA
jgi:hypothetical protein